MKSNQKICLEDEEFAAAYMEHGPAKIAEQFQCNIKTVHTHRERVEKRLGRQVRIIPDRLGNVPTNANEILQSVGWEAKEVIELDVKDGYVLVGSDAHYWPGIISTAHKGFLWACKEFKPKVVILNGDVLDGASVSRWPMGWEYRPDMYEEIEAAFARTEEIRKAARGARRIWTFGNHDSRLELKIAQNLPELKKMRGVHLHDHFEKWERCQAVLVNRDKGVIPTFIKHRFKGGTNAVYNNLIHSGVNMVTGHLHSAQVRPKTLLLVTLFGVDAGTLAEPKGRQFTGYTEASPVDWRSGFAVLRFDKDGRLMYPQLALTVEQGVIEYCNEYIKVAW